MSRKATFLMCFLLLTALLSGCSENKSAADKNSPILEKTAPASARGYIEELLPDVLEGRIQLGRVFDWVGCLEQVPDGYRAMNGREAIKAMIEF